jgi:hypothetical protein
MSRVMTPPMGNQNKNDSMVRTNNHLFFLSSLYLTTKLKA